jgi:ankyrin repeat protein
MRYPSRVRLAVMLVGLMACHTSELVVAIDHGDVSRARTLLQNGASPDAEDDDGNSALMLAVSRGDVELVKLALARHPDVNHSNEVGATALHFAIDDAAKTKLLLDAGANPNVEDRLGLTPLQLAAGRDDGAAVVELLLAHGANAKRVDARVGGSPASAASLLFTRGADPQTPTALAVAANRGNVDVMRMLIAHGVDLNGRAELGMTPLMWAAQMGHPEAVALLLQHGANPNLAETFNKSTALMQAAASDRADASIVKALLDAHADVKPVDDEGASALGWAIRRGDPEIIQLIAAHETEPRPSPSRPVHGTRVGDANTPRAALLRAIPLVENSRPEFRRRAGCPSCHHDALPALALAAAAAHGLPVDQGARQREARATIASFQLVHPRFLEGVGFADDVEAAYLLVGLAATGYPRDDVTEAMARYVALRQAADGSFPTMMQRIPSDGSDVALTALAIRALEAYAPAPERVARARAYLEKVEAVTTEDLVYQLLGLRWAGAPAASVAPLAQTLEAAQRPDGGFAQRAGLRSDAYATGQAIVALREGAELPASDPAIQRAVHFLVTQQIADGSWFVATRALRFQPFIDSGFPQGRSQYSSALATSWALMALADALE